MTPKLSRYFVCRKCEGDIGEAVEKEEMQCDEVETVRVQISSSQDECWWRK